MILPILSYGSPLLRKECDEFEQGESLKELVFDMFETMYGASGVGLAGPQIGILKRIFTVDASPFAEPEEGEELDEKLKELKDFKKVFVNPIIDNETGPSWPFSEGCLSIPGIREDVERKEVIKISYFDENWNFFEESYQGIAARIIQHEYDHIEGILFTDHLNPLKKRLIKRKLEEISKGKVEVNYKMKFHKK
jgi:peptide deformylase|tara:strand:+ start:1497 stop:2078 length:582 start_codon:yes stop_codon:yes gene_type:complete